TPGAFRVISDLRREHGSEVFVGAGSVLSAEVADRAVKTGAQFVVCPHTDAAIFDYCTSRSVLVIAGAITPSEIMAAWTPGSPLVTRPLGRAVLSLAAPTIASLFLQSAFSIVNMIWVGRLGAAPLAAVNASAFIVWTVQALTALTATGTNALVARHVGAGEP